VYEVAVAMHNNTYQENTVKANEKWETHVEDNDAADSVRRDGANKRKVIIFSESRLTLSTLRQYFFKKTHKLYPILDGSKEAKEEEPNLKDADGNPLWKRKVLHQFETDSDCRYIFIQKLVGTVGLNIQCASGVIFVEPWLNAIDHEQALARAWRIGQKRDVLVAFMVSNYDLKPKTKDVVRYATVQNKRERAWQLYYNLFPTEYNAITRKRGVDANISVPVDERCIKEIQRTYPQKRKRD
jgi:hypothetical protein